MRYILDTDAFTLAHRAKGTHADLLIACIVLAHNATLVTRNTKDFANIPGLKQGNWAN